jgi:phospholipase/lecithinase/hemolysin
VATGAASAAGLSALSLQVFNGTLATALKAQNIVFVDPNEILTDVLTKPADYGFKVTVDTDASKALASTACGINKIAATAQFDDATNPSSLYCSTPNTAASNGGTLRTAGADATYVFADGVHPSSQTHKVLADYLGNRLARLLTDAMLAARK